jgi:hypothetical protein
MGIFCGAANAGAASRCPEQLAGRILRQKKLPNFLLKSGYEKLLGRRYSVNDSSHSWRFVLYKISRHSG